MPSSLTTTVAPERAGESRGRALNEFQSKLNRVTYGEGRHREKDRRSELSNGRGFPGFQSETVHRDGVQNREDMNRKGWESAPTPRSVRDGKEADGGSVRIPNRKWDETPRGRGRGGWGKAETSKRDVGWDQTPRSGRNSDRGSPEGDDGLDVGGKEWEEEQVRLDRDWYSHDDEGAVVCAVHWNHNIYTHFCARPETKSTIPSDSGRTSSARKKKN